MIAQQNSSEIKKAPMGVKEIHEAQIINAQKIKSGSSILINNVDMSM
jgi:hypothetical protein